MNTGFHGIFKDKLNKMKAELKTELDRAKTDRRKDFIKRQIKEIKGLRKTVKELEKNMDIKTECPHCGGKL